MDREELVKTLEILDDGIHKVWDNKVRLYQGIVKDRKVLFYVTATGEVYQDNGFENKTLNQTFKEIGNLCGVEDFAIIAKFNKWI